MPLPLDSVLFPVSVTCGTFFFLLHCWRNDYFPNKYLFSIRVLLGAITRAGLPLGGSGELATHPGAFNTKPPAACLAQPHQGAEVPPCSVEPGAPVYPD